jgi:hypothetical protein
MAVRISLHYGVSRPLRRWAGCAQRPTQPEDYSRCRCLLCIRFVSIGPSCGHKGNGRNCGSAKSGAAHCALLEQHNPRAVCMLRLPVHMRGLAACAAALTCRTGFRCGHCGCVSDAGLLPSICLTLNRLLQAAFMNLWFCCFQTDLQPSAGTGNTAVALQVRHASNARNSLN